MNEFLSRNKSALITAAGFILFLGAGMFTAIFFPSESDRRVATSPKISQPPALEFASSYDPEPVAEVPKVSKPKPDWYVYVVGEVKKPGYYKISADTRVFHAIEAAGGFTAKADQTSVNLASVLTDGLQITVMPKNSSPSNIIARPKIPGLAQQPQTPPSGGPGGRTTETKNNSDLVDINNASQTELEKLKGVGPAIAKRIIEYRNANGKFSSPEDLIKVKGIGSAKLEKMRSQILIR
ncbi:MAG: helix-hairpin-helix domain-containing protein [Synergistaceae bacterium]|nr:helix-hairpin-helix domain-containing protein [Synergistaceae bacterium]